MATAYDSRALLLVAAIGASMLAPVTAQAHFVLTSPPAAAEQGGLGDPQKAPPCGDDGTTVTTDIITPFSAGDTVTITIDEKIPHPGHYRISLAINDPSELPAEPAVHEGDMACGTADIMDPPVFPVLADGVFDHDAPFGEPQSIDIVLPDDVNCDHCTLQVIEFMSDHGLNMPGGCFYHHCATISIQGGAADGPSTATASGDESGSSDGEGSSTSITVTTSSQDDSASASASASEGSGSDETASDAGVTAATVASGTDSDSAGSDEDDGGCSCSSGGSAPLFPMIVGVGLLGLRRRRGAAIG
jgi:MYXO-CTERM domain-containing protein